jgi:3-hydroxybutyryl-CoA dehydrogenase
MKVAIRSTEKQKEEILKKGFSEPVRIEWLSEDENLKDAEVDAFFDLTFNCLNLAANTFVDNIVVFANTVNCTCAELNHDNYIRLNAWPGFLNHPLLELAGTNTYYKARAERVLDTTGWKYVWAPDDYGLISPRVISMIVNEAYYALEENVSTKEQIDIAMKLGTNYPYGPFEWSEMIGINNIYRLLEKLSQRDARYTISETLIQTAIKE